MHSAAVRTTLPIPGLKRAIRVLHVTDAHVTLPDDDSPPACVATRERWKGEEVEKRVDEFLSAIRPGEIEALLLTGDIIHFPTRKSLDWICPRLGRVAADTYFIAGNHDSMVPSVYWDASVRDQNLPKLAELFGKRKPTLMDRWEIAGLQFVALDNSTYQIQPEQLTFAKKHFATGMPTVLLMHIPLSTPELRIKTIEKWKSPILLGEPVERITPNFLPQPTLPATAEFVALVKRSPNVRAVLAGHVHFGHEERLTTDTLQLVGPPGFDGTGRLIEFVPG